MEEGLGELFKDIIFGEEGNVFAEQVVFDLKVGVSVVILDHGEVELSKPAPLPFLHPKGLTFYCSCSFIFS